MMTVSRQPSGAYAPEALCSICGNWYVMLRQMWAVMSAEDRAGLVHDRCKNPESYPTNERQ